MIFYALSGIIFLASCALQAADLPHGPYPHSFYQDLVRCFAAGECKLDSKASQNSNKTLTAYRGKDIGNGITKLKLGKEIAYSTERLNSGGRKVSRFGYINDAPAQHKFYDLLNKVGKQLAYSKYVDKSGKISYVLLACPLHKHFSSSEFLEERAKVAASEKSEEYKTQWLKNIEFYEADSEAMAELFAKFEEEAKANRASEIVINCARMETNQFFHEHGYEMTLPSQGFSNSCWTKQLEVTPSDVAEATPLAIKEMLVFLEVAPTPEEQSILILRHSDVVEDEATQESKNIESQEIEALSNKIKTVDGFVIHNHTYFPKGEEPKTNETQNNLEEMTSAEQAPESEA